MGAILNDGGVRDEKIAQDSKVVKLCFVRPHEMLGSCYWKFVLRLNLWNGWKAPTRPS